MNVQEAILFLLTEIELKINRLFSINKFESRSIEDVEYLCYYSNKSISGENYLHQCKVKIIDLQGKYKYMIIKVNIMECGKKYFIKIELEQVREIETPKVNNINGVEWNLWSGDKNQINNGLQDLKNNVEQIVSHYEKAYKFDLR